MKRIRSFLSVSVVCAAGAVAGVVGYNLVQNVQFARAEAQVQASREQLSHAEDLATVFREVGKVVGPSVVNINVHKKVAGAANNNGGGPGGFHFSDPRLRRFFDQDGDGEPDFPGFGPGGGEDGGEGGGGGGYDQYGTGSGVIMEVSGENAYILTNNHVAGGATDMEITFADGRKTKKAKVLGVDPKTDLAVVQVTADKLIAAKWGNSDDLVKGDWIMAFGSPFGYVGSMTHGIVSATNRTDVGILRDVGGYENFIQVDAPINPGNSGGPLVNLRGEVVGINTAIASRTGGFQGIGFSVPSNMAKNIYGQIKERGKVTRGWLGVKIASVSEAQVKPIARDFGYAKDDGVLVQEVMPNTPATGKLENGDIVVGINGKPVDNATTLRNTVASIPPGQETTFRVFRDGKEQDVKLKVGDQPEDLASIQSGRGGGARNRGGAESAKPGEANLEDLGLQLGDLTDKRMQGLNLPQGTKGAVVLRVSPNSAAAKALLSPGEVITRVGGKAVSSAAEAEAALAKADLKKGVRIYVTGRDGSRFGFLSTGGGEQE